jgi:hypothetical protein
MYVNVGNDNAIEGYRDATSDDPDLVRYRPLEGERVTEIVFPEGISLNEAFSTTLAALEHHMADGSSPSWVESDSEGLTALLQEHFGLTKAKTSRPKTWGSSTGAEEFFAAKSEEGTK